MSRGLAPLLLAIIASACMREPSGFSLPTTPTTPTTNTSPSSPAAASPVAPTPPSGPESIREVSIGEQVEGVIGDGRTINPRSLGFSLVAPRQGRLTATLTYDPSYLGTILQLKIDGVTYAGARSSYSPVVAQLPVEGGKQYLLILYVAGADWIPQDKFTLTTKLD